MATKDFTVNSKTFAVSNPNQNDQFSNLNLNSSHKCSAAANLFSSKSSSSIYTGKNKTVITTVSDFTVCSQGKRDVNLARDDKGSKASKFLNFYDSENEETQKRWKKRNEFGDLKNAKTSSSTLSLHLAAYEDSVENESKNEFKKAKTIFSDSFEFPRQQKDDQAGEPEIMQFKSSQKVLNPNETSSANSNNKKSRKGSSIKSDVENINFKNLKFNTKYTVTIKASEMPVEMIEKAVLLADEAMQKHNDDGDIAQYIKHGFDLISPPWHCVVGRKFSSLITHEHGYFLYFFIGKLACVLFKARD